MKNLLVWLSNPDNLALVGMATGFLLSLAKIVAQKLNLRRAATALGDAQEKVETTTKALVVVAQGVEKVKVQATKGDIDAKGIALILQDHAEKAGVEGLIAPIVSAVQAQVPTEIAVRRATGRL